MKKSVVAAFAVFGLATAAFASNLNVSVRSNGVNEIHVGSGAVVPYEVFGVLSDSQNEGLALFGFDLTADCGISLPRANVPNTAPMNNFVTPLGINNPPDALGFGGTPQNGMLKQVGGGQNTIKNTIDNAPFPIAETVLLGLGQPPAGLVLVNGSFTAPQTDVDLVCHVTLGNLFGNVIKDGETGEIFFKTEAFGAGTITNLTVHVTAVPEGVTLVSSTPACNGSLWRSEKNAILLDFDGQIAAPTAGQIEIVPLLANGMFGANVNNGSNFTFAVQNGGTRLRISEVGTVLAHRTWYRVRHANWPNVTDFAVDLVVQVGDASGDGRVLAIDVGTVNAGVPCASCPDDRRDMNGDNRILALDVGIANARVPSPNVTKPSGHTSCP